MGVYKDLRQHQRAIKNFNTAIRLKPDYADDYNNRGTVYINHDNNKFVCYDAQKACGLENCKTLKVAKGRKYCP